MPHLRSPDFQSTVPGECHHNIHLLGLPYHHTINDVYILLRCIGIIFCTKIVQNSMKLMHKTRYLIPRFKLSKVLWGGAKLNWYVLTFCALNPLLIQKLGKSYSLSLRSNSIDDNKRQSKANLVTWALHKKQTSSLTFILNTIGSSR